MGDGGEKPEVGASEGEPHHHTGGEGPTPSHLTAGNDDGEEGPGAHEAGAPAAHHQGTDGHIDGPSVLIGGLGVGFSLVEAVAEPRWGRIVVAEREQAVIDWHLRGPLAELTAPALADPRTEILHTDLVAYLRGTPQGADQGFVEHSAPCETPTAPEEPGSAGHASPVAAEEGNGRATSSQHTGAAPPVTDSRSTGGGQRYDALCLDIDNGPDWTVTEDNDGLYSPAGLAACRERLNPGGVLAIWSARPSAAFEEALRNAGFTSVRTEEITVARGVPDVVHLAIRGA